LYSKTKETHKATITAMGDILLHGRVYGGLGKKDNFDFVNQLSKISHLVGKTNITVANLESIIAGTEFGLSGFPKFNAPAEIGYALKELGVDIVTIANNHVLDYGEKGLIKSIKNLKKIGLIYDGAYESKEDNDKLRVFNINGLKIAFISYTNGTNGNKLPEDKVYMVNSFKNTPVIKVSKLLRSIRKENIVDVIILNLHFGSEYHLLPSDKQKRIVRTLSEAGANIILGHHPHVLQPPEWIENSHGSKTFVAYSLGNFFSGQNGLYRQIGATLNLTIKKPDPQYQNIIIENPKYNLTFTNREERLKYSIDTLQNWVNLNEFIETKEGKFKSKEIYENIKNRMRLNIKDIEIE